MARQNHAIRLPLIVPKNLSFSLEDSLELEGEAPTMQPEVGQPSERRIGWGGCVAVDLLTPLDSPLNNAHPDSP